MIAAGHVACRAPWTALHFDQYGWATACTANKRDVLGHVGSTSLEAIWRGAAAQRFRSAFEGGGLAPGCEVCAWQRGSGGDEAMYARLYDGGAVAEGDLGPTHVEFAMSNRCNLACRMCNGALSSSIRGRREGLPPLEAAYPDRFFDELRALTPVIQRAKFLGGEPFLAPENFRVWEGWAEDGAEVACHVTTNGTVWNERISAVLDAVPMSFAVSLDGATAATVERIRVGADLATILANLDRFVAHAAAHGTDVSLTFCLMTDNWDELLDFLRLADRLDLSAFVNTVLSPSHLSLYRLPHGELRRIIGELEGRRAEAESLGRNRPVWEDQLNRLRASADATPIWTDTPVHLSALDPPPLEPDGPVADDLAATATLHGWSAVEPVRLDVDVDGHITQIAEGHLAPLHVGRLVGLHVDELFVWLYSAFGRPDGSEHLRHAPSAGDRTFRFADASRATEVRTVSRRRGDGAVWLVSTRPAG